MYTEILKWAAMIELPVFAALFRMMLKHKKECEQSINLCKEDLNEFKLHVARNYVSITYLKDVEARLTNHLLRIEKKLDYMDRRDD